MKIKTNCDKWKNGEMLMLKMKTRSEPMEYEDGVQAKGADEIGEQLHQH